MKDQPLQSLHFSIFHKARRFNETRGDLLKAENKLAELHVLHVLHTVEYKGLLFSLRSL